MGYLPALRKYGVGADDTVDDIEIEGQESPTSGALTPADFNSTRYPGICKPMNQRALNFITELQRQLNRLAHVKGVAKIGVDGDVGPKTINLLTALGLATMGASCMATAVGAPIITPIIKQKADAAGAPTTVAGPPPLTPPTYITPTGQLRPDASSAGSVMDAFNAMSTGQKVVAAGLLAGIGFLGFKELSKKKR